MLNDILFAVWFMLPAALANVAPIFAKRIPIVRHLNAPIDGNARFRGREVLGAHKTWRGLIAGIIVATIVMALQVVAFHYSDVMRAISGPVDYSQPVVWLLGPLLGLGALAGDAIESFFKRQRDIPSGKAWLLFDQLDYIFGALVASLPFVILSAAQYLWIIVIWFIVHVASTYIGWRLKLKDSPI